MQKYFTKFTSGKFQDSEKERDGSPHPEFLKRATSTLSREKGNRGSFNRLTPTDIATDSLTDQADGATYRWLLLLLPDSCCICWSFWPPSCMSTVLMYRTNEIRILVRKAFFNIAATATRRKSTCKSCHQWSCWTKWIKTMWIYPETGITIRHQLLCPEVLQFLSILWDNGINKIDA